MSWWGWTRPLPQSEEKAGLLQRSPWPGPLPFESWGSSQPAPGIYNTRARACKHTHTHTHTSILAIFGGCRDRSDLLASWLQGWMFVKSLASGVSLPGRDSLPLDFGQMPSPPQASASSSAQWDSQSLRPCYRAVVSLPRGDTCKALSTAPGGRYAFTKQ